MIEKESVEKLALWFKEKRRDLPWRETADPYAVFVSEVMLQQTQVAVVIPYYLRWMECFPTIEALAHAPLDAVIKVWEGLGYYSRARNLHAAAKQLVKDFGGKLPEDPEALKTIKGIGPYTLGAIRSFAFKKKAAAVDGNVIRVLARFFAIEEDVTKAKNIKRLREIAEELLPDKEPWVIAEALIELGATVCKASPQCLHCPLKARCRALALGKTDTLPYKSKAVKTSALYRSVAVIFCDGHLLLKQGKVGQVMEGLYEFPYFETQSLGLTEKQLVEEVQKSFGLDAAYVKALEKVEHSFTRYRATLMPSFLTADAKREVENCSWHPLERLGSLTFSSGHRRILQSLLFASKSFKYL